MKISTIHIQLSVLLTIILLLGGCETYIDYKGEITEPQLVVFAQAIADDTMACQVAHSIFFLHDTVRMGKGEKLRIDDAQISWKINDAAWDSNADGALVAHSGDSVRLRVEHPDYPVAGGVQTVPYKESFNAGVQTETANEYTLQLSFDTYAGASTDVLAIEIYADIYDEETDTTRVEQLSLDSTDPLFTYLNTREEGLIGLIANRRSTLFVPAGVLPAAGGLTAYKPYGTTTVETLHIYCHSITADYYRYMRTTEDANGVFNSLIGFGTEEKVQVYGNLTGAIGIFGAIATNRVILNELTFNNKQ